MGAGLDRTLAEVRAWVARGRAPTRHHARDLLVGLGELLLSGREAEAQPALAEARRWLEAAPVPWREAIAAEMAMAATEHVRSVDPRWLEHPQYDLEYVVEARHRLEARLACAEALGVEVAEEHLAGIARADALLAPRLAGARPDGNEKV